MKTPATVICISVALQNRETCRQDIRNGKVLLEDQLGIQEIPITTLRVGQKNLPIAGGGYFRLLPYVVTRWGLNQINSKEQQPFVFYLHPWEFDPKQPRMAGASAKSKFRHYLNLSKTEGRFRRLLADFAFQPIMDGL